VRNAPLGERAIGLVLLALCLSPAVALAGEARVRFQDGLVSVVFDATPAPEAFEAIQRATGVEVLVPPSARGKTLTLAVEQVSFEVFLRRLHEALDLGGFALEYGPGGAPDRLFVAEKGAAPAMAAPGAPSVPSPTAGWTRATAAAGRVSVPFLMRTTEADSMKLGAAGQVMVVESMPFAKTTTSECDGTPGRYPVQTVLVTEAANTYITSIIVCNAGGLGPGQTLMPARMPTDAEGRREDAGSRATPGQRAAVHSMDDDGPVR
jgi:hypothetical protein